jgi:hypothetical protein
MFASDMGGMSQNKMIAIRGDFIPLRPSSPLGSSHSQDPPASDESKASSVESSRSSNAPADPPQSSKPLEQLMIEQLLQSHPDIPDDAASLAETARRSLASGGRCTPDDGLSVPDFSKLRNASIPDESTLNLEKLRKQAVDKGPMSLLNYVHQVLQEASKPIPEKPQTPSLSTSSILPETEQLFRFSESTTSHEYTIPTGFLINGTRVITQVDCDFPLKNHPDIETYIELAYTLAIEAKMYPSDPKYKETIKTKIRESYYVHLAVNTLPDSADHQKLADIVTWIFLLFGFDNVIDNSKPGYVLPTTPKLLKKYTHLLLRILRGEDISEETFIQTLQSTCEKGIPICKEEMDLALIPFRLAKHITTREPSFLTEAKRYFDSSLIEMHNPTAMDLPSYLSIRESSGAIDTVTRLAERELPDYLRTNKTFELMNKEIVKYIWAVNDLGGAKEWLENEPAFLKIQTKYHLANFNKYANVPNSKENMELAFKTSLEELIKLINSAHKEYFRLKAEVLNLIEDGSIFDDTETGDRMEQMSATERSLAKETAKLDFLQRCAIRENLAVAGNECTKISKRYVDYNNPEKNVDITKVLPK